MSAHNIEVRDDYQDRPVKQWTRDECIAWCIDEGVYSCGMEIGMGTAEEAREEVLLQKENIETELETPQEHNE